MLETSKRLHKSLVLSLISPVFDIFSPLVLVFVFFCQLFLVRSPVPPVVSKLLLLKSHCAVSWKWLSAVRSIVTRVITLELGRSQTCPQPPTTPQQHMHSADWRYVETELFVVDNRSWKLLSFSNLYSADDHEARGYFVGLQTKARDSSCKNIC